MTNPARSQLDERVRPKAAKHLRQFSREVNGRFPGQVSKILLFGSRARGDAKSKSDYDVAVVMTAIDDRRAVDHQLADLAYPHILAGVHIRPMSVPASALDGGADRPLIANLKRDGLEVGHGP
ncbi:nucleotidyltransferase domain-containing protein [Brevundimonas sp.]|jgi:predicted nucleotidyltransferase|uniref:nucleotidyltransferase domain-containing protein n=1 Tax=Brevundimonas sp. TaxID=1871086 RepID=UPI002E0E98B0|nr:nucleotidyltransferase domain-containing protein [Brevundimonas sp.]